MRCAEFEERLQHLLDERADVSSPERLAPGMRRHAVGCPRCERSWHGMRTLLVGLEACFTPRPSANLADRVLAEVATASRSSALSPRATARTGSLNWQSADWWKSNGLLALAAMAVMTITMVAMGRQPSGAFLAIAPPAIEAPPSIEASPSPVAPLAMNPPQAEAEFKEVDFDLGEFDPLAFSNLWQTELADRPAWMLSQVAEGLRPLTSSMTGTINLLLDVWRGEGEEPQPASQGARYDRTNPHDRLA